MKSLKECVQESIFDVEDNVKNLNVAIDIYGATKRVLNRFKEISRFG